MAENYRKAVGSAVWHFCSNCSTWPTEDYITSSRPQQIGNEVLCSECVARHDIGECENFQSAEIFSPRKCPVIHNGKECGRDLYADLAAGIYCCSAGHRGVIVPPRRPKK
jgi:hypothetical protein